MTECSKSAAFYLSKSIILCVGILKICEIGLLSQFSHYQDTKVKYEASPKFETFELVIFENRSVYFEDSLIPDYEEEGHSEENEDNPQTPNEDQTYYGTVFKLCRGVIFSSSHHLEWLE